MENTEIHIESSSCQRQEKIIRGPKMGEQFSDAKLRLRIQELAGNFGVGKP